ncbi:MAG: NHL repeat-containing protein [bacterium]|jgi:tripartite motif-containing protein 71
MHKANYQARTLITLVVFVALTVVVVACGAPAYRQQETPPQEEQVLDALGYTKVEVLSTLAGEPLLDPAGVAVDSDGNIFVSDAAKHQIYKYSPEGRLLAEIGSQGSGAAEFTEPTALDIDQAGNLYVADQGNNRVQVLTSSGKFLRQVGSREEFAPFFALIDGWDTPLTGVAVDVAGNIYLTLRGAYYDISENALRKYNPSGQLIWEMKSMLEGDVDFLPFTWPAAVTVDQDGTVYMVHGANGAGKVLKIPYDGDTILADDALQFGNLGKEQGELMHTPQGIAVDALGYIYVADTHNNRIQIFTPAGEWAAMIRLQGSAAGALTEPTNLTLDQAGYLYVVDKGNARVLKLSNPIR